MERYKLSPHKDGPNRWRVEIPKSISTLKPPRRERHFFPTLDRANRFVTRTRTSLKETGISARILHTRDLVDANEAIRLLHNHTLRHRLTNRPSLREIALSWIEQWEREHHSISLDQLFAEFLGSRTVSEKHEWSIGYTRRKLKRLAGVQVCDLTHTELSACLEGLPPASYNAHLRRIKSVLNYGMKHCYLRSNPALRFNRIEQPKKPVQVLPMGVVEQLLRVAEVKFPKLLCFLTVSLFAGVRSAEVFRLRWGDFRWTDKTLVIESDVSKTRRRRFITLSDNLLAWLAKHQQHLPVQRVMGGMKPDTLRYQRRQLWQLVRKANPQLPEHAYANGLRHSYCSYHLAYHRNVNELVLQSGHDDADTMWTHYHQGVSSSDATKYWAIYPTKI
jgi:integrase